jgi:hypothetical protein
MFTSDHPFSPREEVRFLQICPNFERIGAENTLIAPQVPTNFLGYSPPKRAHSHSLQIQKILGRG